MAQDKTAPTGPEIRARLKITTIEKNTPVYIEAYRRIRRLIKEDIWQFGDALPGETELAAYMGIGRTSLRTALSLLYEDGYIKTRQGKGSYVSFDGRREKYRRKTPMGFVFPPQRIALRGEMTKSRGVLGAVGEDGFLSEKFAPGPGQEILLFARVYRLNGADAIYATCYFRSDLVDCEILDDIDAMEERIFSRIADRAAVAEYECLAVPGEVVREMELPCEFAGTYHTLAATTYVDRDNQVVGFCKDYYNDEVIRFTMGSKK
ncbi:MAG: GntR family transcriptional regulator [Lachnospiraceae bacterium]|nr:GntR family transcriptional regulator [Lachnospiraceae bacterium]